MKTLKKITVLTLLLVHTIGFSQSKNEQKEANSKKVELKKEVKVDAKKLKKFIGKYDLSEGNITLEIVQEKDKMYIISPWSKDLLKVKDENTLIEPTRGVYLNIIKDNKNALKYFQNGYETTIKKINSK